MNDLEILFNVVFYFSMFGLTTTILIMAYVFDTVEISANIIKFDLNNLSILENIKSYVMDNIKVLNECAEKAESTHTPTLYYFYIYTQLGDIKELRDSRCYTVQELLTKFTKEGSVYNEQCETRNT